MPCFNLQRERFTLYPTVIAQLDKQKAEIQANLMQLQRCYQVLEELER